MKIIDENTPTGELNDIKIGDAVSNGLGTFGEVVAIDFEVGDGYWKYLFKLVGGGLIEVTKAIPTC